jgi:crotonobetainyl-CoA:carnitine CoA-transferase CaiB-like acyl-CoA transferase
MTTSQSAGPLADVVVADFSRILAGLMCTMILADLGADVIKIERPGTGDDTRTWGPPFVEADAAYFLSVNRNKRSIDLDLDDPEDLRTATEVVERADVLVENFRPGVMESFGLSYHDVRDANPGVIYCSMPAFSHPDLRHKPGYDLLMQAYSGFMSITGEPGREPVKMGVAILDVIAGLYGAVAILAALRGRRDRGIGQQLEVGLFEASVASLINQASNYLNGDVVPSAGGTAHPNIVPYQAFTASDGLFVLAAANDKLFKAACDAMGRPDIGIDERFATNAHRVLNREELLSALDTIFATQSLEHWLEVFERAGVPAADARSIDQVFGSPEGAAMVGEIDDPNRGLLRLVRSPIRFGDGSGSSIESPPVLGENSEEIRAWIRDTPIEGNRHG